MSLLRCCRAGCPRPTEVPLGDTPPSTYGSASVDGGGVRAPRPTKSQGVRRCLVSIPPSRLTPCHLPLHKGGLGFSIPRKFSKIFSLVARFGATNTTLAPIGERVVTYHWKQNAPVPKGRRKRAILGRRAERKALPCLPLTREVDFAEGKRRRERTTTPQTHLR